MTTVEELHAELQTLRDEVRRLQHGHDAPSETPPRLMSRRNLLRAAPVVAMGGALATLAAGPVSANVGDPVLQGESNHAGAGKTTALDGGTPWVLGGVDYHAPKAFGCGGGLSTDWFTAIGVEIGTTTGQAALYVNPPYMSGYAAHFVAGPASDGPIYEGTSVVLIEGSGPGVGLTIGMGDNSDSLPGSPVLAGGGIVVGTASGTGIEVTTSHHGHAAVLNSTDSTADKDAVVISYAGHGKALYAESTGTENSDGAVTGVNVGNGAGLKGQHTSTDQSGFGVVGQGGVYGRGAQLSGGAAAVQLVPSTATTHPSNGNAGDLFVDSRVRLWFCQKDQVGAIPAVWTRVV